MLGFTTTMMCTWESALPYEASFFVYLIDSLQTMLFAMFCFFLTFASKVLSHFIYRWRPCHHGLRIYIRFLWRVGNMRFTR